MNAMPNPDETPLMFERFLAHGRPTPPDIDTNFSDRKRAKVMKYLEKKYGTKKSLFNRIVTRLFKR